MSMRSIYFCIIPYILSIHSAFSYLLVYFLCRLCVTECDSCNVFQYRHFNRTIAAIEQCNQRPRMHRPVGNWSTTHCTQNISGTQHLTCICAYPSPTSPTGSTYVLLAAGSSSFRATVVRNSAVGPSLLLARWPGMPYRTPLETQPCQPVLSDAL